MGTVFYMGVEASEGYNHLVGVVSPHYNSHITSHLFVRQDWPPRFDSYLKLKYFWFIFIFLNSIWIVVPIYYYYEVYCKLNKALGKYKLD